MLSCKVHVLGLVCCALLSLVSLRRLVVTMVMMIVAWQKHMSSSAQSSRMCSRNRKCHPIVNLTTESIALTRVQCHLGLDSIG